MPTTQSEVLYIASIIDDVLGPDDVNDGEYLYIKSRLTRELAEKVGYLTENYSVRRSLFDLCLHYNPNWRIREDIINKLVNEWHDTKSTLNLSEFVGMSYKDWELYCEGKYQCF